ncbi:MAG: tetratricopeptide repeat protein, partial [Bryobacteraceae bacterium]
MLAHWLPLLAGILISGCSWNRIVEAPALPEPKAEQFSPAVRDRLQGAYQAALAHPSDAGAVGRYGMVLQAHGQRESALSCYRSAQALAPGTFEWPYYLGVAAAELGDHHAASSAFEQALKLRPGYLPARLRYADAVLESGGVSRSLELYQSIVQDYPTLATPLYGLGQAQERSGRTKQAAESLQKALDLYPDYSAAQYALAMVYRRLGDTQASNRLMERYESSGKTAPPIEDPVLGAMRGLDASAQAHLRRSLELAAAGRLEEAAKANLAALEINPKLVRAHVNLISLYGRLGREEEAARHYHSAIEIQPGSPESHYNFGVMLVSAGRVDEGRAAFQ